MWVWVPRPRCSDCLSTNATTPSATPLTTAQLFLALAIAHPGRGIDASGGRRAAGIEPPTPPTVLAAPATPTHRYDRQSQPNGGIMSEQATIDAVGWWAAD